MQVAVVVEAEILALAELGAQESVVMVEAVLEETMFLQPHPQSTEVAVVVAVVDILGTEHQLLELLV
jgi:hypothetical protein